MKIYGFLLILMPTMLLAQSHDTVWTAPELPTVKDSIVFSLFNYNYCCCSQYYSNIVEVADTTVYLSYEVDTAPCLLCGLCFAPGSNTVFKSGPLAAGRYDVYKAESPYCAPGDPCPEYAIVPKIVGQVTVIEDDTFKIELVYYVCKAPPCPDYRVISLTKGETTLVVGVKNPDGSYQNPFSRDLVPWRDEGYPVLGYFTTDSLNGWLYRDTVFAIAQVVGWPAVSVEDHSIEQANQSLFTVYPQPITSAAMVKVPRAGMVFKVYAADGKPVEIRIRIEGNKIAWNTSSLSNGIYLIRFEEGDKFYTKKVLVRK